MPLRRADKATLVESMAGRLGRAQAVVIADYRGLNVATLSQLRRKLRSNGSEIQVIKNTLVRRAFDAAGMQPPDTLLEGPTAIVLMFDELQGPAKTLQEFVKTTQILSIKGGILGGRQIDAKTVDALADLPSRDELRSMFLSTLQAPMRNYVTVLSAPMRNFVNVLNARARDEGAAAAA